MALKSRSRLAGLDDIFRSIAQNVYFQPPETIKMKYPCIIYHLDDYYILHADNNPYQMQKRYLVTVVDKNPDSEIKDEVASLPMCSFSRHYTADNLNHDVFTIYY